MSSSTGVLVESLLLSSMGMRSIGNRGEFPLRIHTFFIGYLILLFTIVK